MHIGHIESIGVMRRMQPSLAAKRGILIQRRTSTTAEKATFLGCCGQGLRRRTTMTDNRNAEIPFKNTSALSKKLLMAWISCPFENVR
jgi:hypothetical protein